MNMIRTYLHIPLELNQSLTLLTKRTKVSKAEILREALTLGVEQLAKRNDQSAQALLRMAKEAERLDIAGDKDLAGRMNDYAWD